GEREPSPLDPRRSVLDGRGDEVIGGVLEVPDLSRVETVQVDLRVPTDERQDRLEELVRNVKGDEQVVLRDRPVEPGLEQERVAREPMDLGVPGLLEGELLALLRRPVVRVERERAVKTRLGIGGATGRKERETPARPR